MNKKKLLILISVLMVLFLATGCSIPKDSEGNNILITLDTTFQQMMDSEGFFSAIFVYPLSQFINIITPYTNVGISILVVTAVINGLVVLVTLKQNIAMQRMQQLQPEIQRIQRKYEGRTDQNSKMRMAQEMQNLYSKNHINPMSSFIGLFIQFPILIAMYMACQRAEAVAKGSFFGISLEPTPLAGITGGQWVYAVFFLLMLGIQLSSIMIPQWLAKRRAKKEAELHHRPYRPTPNPMGNTMYFMMIFIFVLAINWPTAMTFYWIVSGIVNIVKAVIVDAIANRKKEA